GASARPRSRGRRRRWPSTRCSAPPEQRRKRPPRPPRSPRGPSLVATRTPTKRRGSILVSLLLLLFVVGIVPLLWTSLTLVGRSRETLELDQKSIQLDKARSLSQQVAVYARSLQSQITAIARTLEVGTAPEQFTARVNSIRETKALERYVGGSSPF